MNLQLVINSLLETATLFILNLYLSATSRFIIFREEGKKKKKRKIDPS